MSGIIDLFVPKDKKFLQYIDSQAGLLDDCAKQLNKISKKGKIDSIQLHKTLNYINKKSEESDLITRETISFLHKTFITPIDREEIKALTTNLNHIIDSIKKIVNCILYFKIEKLDSHLLEQLKILDQIITTLKLIFKEPLHLEKNRADMENIKKHEDKADEVFKKAMGGLFDCRDPIKIIKQKEMYEITEDAIDDTRKIVDILETVLINNL